MTLGGEHPKGLNTETRAAMYGPMSAAALSQQKQPRVCQWSVTRPEKGRSDTVRTWPNVENTILRENPVTKDNCCLTPLTCNIENGQIQRQQVNQK